MERSGGEDVTMRPAFNPRPRRAVGVEDGCDEMRLAALADEQVVALDPLSPSEEGPTNLVEKEGVGPLGRVEHGEKSPSKERNEDVEASNMEDPMEETLRNRAASSADSHHNSRGEDDPELFQETPIGRRRFSSKKNAGIGKRMESLSLSSVDLHPHGWDGRKRPRDQVDTSLKNYPDEDDPIVLTEPLEGTVRRRRNARPMQAARGSHLPLKDGRRRPLDQIDEGLFNGGWRKC